MTTYRVRALWGPVVHYQGRSFTLASDVFDSVPGSRVMERRVIGGDDDWRDVMSYQEFSAYGPQQICEIPNNSSQQEG